MIPILHNLVNHLIDHQYHLELVAYLRPPPLFFTPRTTTLDNIYQNSNRWTNLNKWFRIKKYQNLLEQHSKNKQLLCRLRNTAFIAWYSFKRDYKAVTIACTSSISDGEEDRSQ